MSWIVDVLSQHVTTERIERMRQILDLRTRNLALVLEDIYDPHNMSAVVRTAEAYGIQEVHVVEGSTPFQPNRKIAQGAHKWVEIHHHWGPPACVDELHRRGFEIWAGALTPQARPMTEIDFGRKVALVFGNEHQGLTPAFLQRADHVFTIPMIGFTQSLNISVSAAIASFHAVQERIRLRGTNGDLEDADKTALLETWLRKTVPFAEQILDRCSEKTKQSNSFGGAT